MNKIMITERMMRIMNVEEKEEIETEINIMKMIHSINDHIFKFQHLFFDLLFQHCYLQHTL